MYMKEHIEDSIPERYLSWKVVSRKFSEYLVLKFPPRQKLSFSQINLQIVCKIEIQLSFLMVLFAVKFFIFMVFCQLDEEISQYITIVVTNENFVRKEKFRKSASCIITRKLLSAEHNSEKITEMPSMYYCCHQITYPSR